MKSWVEISGARLGENLRVLQAVAGPAAEVLAVVKANGYGHDAATVARALVRHGARWLGVSDLEEGVLLRRTVDGSGVRLLVMCGMELGDAPALVANGLTPVVWTVEHIAALERAARAAGSRMAVHLEVDTGMARQGVTPGAGLAEVLARLGGSRWVALEGVMSHLASSEAADAVQTRRQQERFAAALQQVQAAGLHPELVHLGNSSALDEGSTRGWLQEQARRLGARTMVRPGLAVFGYCLPLEGATTGGLLAGRLQPVLAWKTRVIGLREIAAGTTVGYGATFTATAPMRLALLPVGYADGLRREASSGLSRDASGGGWVCIAGRRAAVVGRVSMNLTTVDVTGLPEVALGDGAVLLGEGVTAHDHAGWCGTLPYEILCGIRATARLV